MFKGLGKNQRMVAAIFEAEPNRPWTVKQLARRLFPEHPQHSDYQNFARAVRSTVRHFGWVRRHGRYMHPAVAVADDRAREAFFRQEAA